MTSVPAGPASSGGLTEEQWDDLLREVKAGMCTPIVGAGACYPALPLASEIAERLALEHGYPLTDISNLARVTQYLATKRYQQFPKSEVLDEIRRRSTPLPDFDASDDPHGVLASLPASIYITTNYDNLLEEALRKRPRHVEHDSCEWNGYRKIAGTPSIFSTGYQPDEGHPLVYHLHGELDVPESIVLTEEDYLSFLLRANEEGAGLLPPPIRVALASNALLFVGYSMTDWTFRVLFRSLIEMIRIKPQRPAVAIQVPPTDVLPGHEATAREYLEQYHRSLQGIDVRMYWGTARDFARELRTRWEAYK